MMQCSDMRTALGTYLDEELTPLEVGRVQEHLADCDVCRSTLESEAWLHAALTADAMTDAPPDTLRQSIMDRVTVEAAAVSSGRPYPRRRRVLQVVGSGAAILLVATLMLVFRAPAGPTAAAFVLPHREFVERAAALPDIAVGPELKGWLDRHIGAVPSVPAQTADGERIVGGRMSIVAGHWTVQLLYQGDGRRLSLFISTRPLQRQQGESERVVERVDVYTSDVEGTRIAWWRDGPHVYVATGAVETDDLLEFAALCVRGRQSSVHGAPRSPTPWRASSVGDVRHVGGTVLSIVSPGGTAT
jgi:anti-sigma factor RsiW